MSDYNAARAWVAEQRRLEDSSQAYIRRDPFDGGTDEDARRNAEYWAWDANLQAEALKIAAAERERKKAELAAYHAERQAERDAAWAAGAGERAERKKQEERELAERELAEREAELLRRNVEDALRAQADAEIAAREKQDNDFHAFSLRITLEIETSGQDDDEETIAGPDITEALSPWINHYQALGLIRGDDDNGVWSFHLVCRADDEPLAPASLLTFPDARLSLNSMPGATLVVSSSVEPINATMLYDTARERPATLGPCGGELTPKLAPAEVESRGDWLARLAMPARTIARTAERWKRSGGNLRLFGLFGCDTERSVGDRPLEEIIPGLLFRGYTSLLVAPKKVGKSTLLGEMAAVIDSECQSKRTVLGVEVIARGVSGIVSGEDGDPLGLVIDISRIPWPEALRLLHDVPRLDFLGIDPLRTILEGDEDSSGVISTLFNDLNHLARVKNCAILLCHHTGKKTPNALSGLLAAARGSAVITDRPRMGMGLLDRGGGISEFGVISKNFAPDVKLWGEVNAGKLFRRDDETLTLVPVEGRSQSSEPPLAPGDTLELIYTAVVDENSRGNVVRRTGKSELFERRLPRLAALSRNVIRDGVSTLLAAGRLIDGPEGLMAVGTAPLRLGA